MRHRTHETAHAHAAHTDGNIWHDPIMPVLQRAFDGAYLELLEDSVVSLDDQRQARERYVVAQQVYETLTQVCEEAGYTPGQRMDYVCQHAYTEIQRCLHNRLADAQNAEQPTDGGLTSLVPALQEMPEEA